MEESYTNEMKQVKKCKEYAAELITVVSTTQANQKFTNDYAETIGILKTVRAYLRGMKLMSPKGNKKQRWTSDQIEAKRRRIKRKNRSNKGRNRRGKTLSHFKAHLPTRSTKI